MEERRVRSGTVPSGSVYVNSDVIRAPRGTCSIAITVPDMTSGGSSAMRWSQITRSVVWTLPLIEIPDLVAARIDSLQN